MDESSCYGNYSRVSECTIYPSQIFTIPTHRLCSDAEIVRQIWDRYDGARVNSSSKVFSSLITALKRLATEKPALLGASSQIYGLGVPSTSTSQSTLDLGGASGYGIETVAGVVASAANMVGIGSGAGLSVQGASMKLQWYVWSIKC